MGHDISAYNQAGEEIAYARFSMGNYNASILYSLFDADDYHAGVSGSGGSATYSIQQIEKALNDFERLYNNGVSADSDSDFAKWDRKQILDFIINCSETVQKEGI